MTDNEREIHELITAPLVIPKTKRERRRDLIQRVCSVLSVLGFTIAAVTTVLYFHLASCTNTNLGQRSAPNTADKTALKTYLAQQNLAIREIGSGNRVGGFDLLNSSYDTYAAQTERDAKMLAAAPIGQC